MAKRILVPLDQSEESESVVPLVVDATRGGQASIRLLHVVPGPAPDNCVDEQGRTVVYADQEIARLEAEALDYLRAVAMQFAETPVECAVRFGDPVREIPSEVEDFGADLIAVSTTARTRLGRTLRGSVPEQLLRKASAAVVLLRPRRHP